MLLTLCLEYAAASGEPPDNYTVFVWVRELPAQVECPRCIKRQHSEMFLMNIFVRERKGI